MRILICASSAPLPPPNGLRLVVDCLWRELRKDHEVRVLAFVGPDQEPSSVLDPNLRLVPLRPLGRRERAYRFAIASLRGRPSSTDRFAAAMRGPLGQELEAFKPDVVHVTTGALAGLAPALTNYRALLAVLDAWHLNIDAWIRVTTGLHRLLLKTQARRVRRFQASEYRRFARVVAVTEEDRDALLELDPGATINVVTNGVDIDAFAPGAAGTVDRSRLVFSGVMKFGPNIAAAEFLAHEVFPRVRAVRPDATLAIVGREPVPRVLALGELDGVTVTGEVDDIASWIAGSRAFVCPMRTGTGIKNKLLEAMACGVPCVATPLATQGLQCASGRELLVARDAEALASAALRVLNDDGLTGRLGSAARAYVAEHHSWREVARRYERLYQAVLDE